MDVQNPKQIYSIRTIHVQYNVRDAIKKKMQNSFMKPTTSGMLCLTHRLCWNNAIETLAVSFCVSTFIFTFKQCAIFGQYIGCMPVTMAHNAMSLIVFIAIKLKEHYVTAGRMPNTWFAYELNATPTNQLLLLLLLSIFCRLTLIRSVT